MKKIIKEKITMLEKRYETQKKNYNTEHITESAKEFFRLSAVTTEVQIMLLKDILRTYKALKE